ncbi:hypothetical protein ACFX13_001990 [Malus domestica]
MMLLSQVIFEKYGWGVAAKITPTMLLLTGVGFFSLILFGGPLSPVVASLGMTHFLVAIYVSALQNFFSETAKYNLFDQCKEMAYIPLDEDTKVKGKATIDVVCNPMGKSGGALIRQFMILTFGSLTNLTPYLGEVWRCSDPANSSTERLKIFDDESHIISFSMVGGDHRLSNYRSASTETLVRRDTTPVADDSSTGLSDAIPAPACNAMIFEALSASTNPNALDTSAIASFIEGRVKGSEC